jgi:DNA-binding NtrC family response regulator
MTLVTRRDDQTREDAPLPGMIGEHPLMKEVYRLVRLVAPTEDPVMLVGETGTGKELVARALHELSGLSGEFIAVNAAAIPESLFESELFGHERGAFSEARTSKPGLLEMAHGGTLFCDELPAMSAQCQAKLLRVVEEGVLRRLGGVQPRPARPRWIAACQAIAASARIRSDLWHRLAGAFIVLPPLADRRSDIPLLVAHFLADFPDLRVEACATERFASLDWPGNVRQLRNTVRFAAALGRDGAITIREVNAALRSFGALELEQRPRERELMERLVKVLQAHGGDTAAAARSLGIARSTLYLWLKKAHITPRRDGNGFGRSDGILWNPNGMPT